MPKLISYGKAGGRYDKLFNSVLQQRVKALMESDAEVRTNRFRIDEELETFRAVCIEQLKVCSVAMDNGDAKAKDAAADMIKHIMTEIADMSERAARIERLLEKQSFNPVSFAVLICKFQQIIRDQLPKDKAEEICTLIEDNMVFPSKDEERLLPKAIIIGDESV